MTRRTFLMSVLILTSPAQARQKAPVVEITIDGHGQVFWGQTAMTNFGLKKRLADLWVRRPDTRFDVVSRNASITQIMKVYGTVSHLGFHVALG